MLSKLIDVITKPYVELLWGMATPALIISIVYLVTLLGFYICGKIGNTLRFRIVSPKEYPKGKRNQLIISATICVLQIPVCIVLPFFFEKENIVVKLAKIYLEYEPILFVAVFLFLSCTLLNTKNKDRHITAANQLFQVLILLSVGAGLLAEQLNYKLWQNHMVLTFACIIYFGLFLLEVKTGRMAEGCMCSQSMFSYNPVEDIDLLFPQHKSQAEYISRIIRDSSSDPFSICLSGKWGMGKTSVIKGAIDKMRKDGNDNAFIWINALELDDKKSLLTYFLSQIKKKLQEKGVYVGIGSEYKDFVASLTGIITNNTVGSLLQKKLSQYNDDYRQQKESLEEVLASAFENGKLVVVVDDIERCTKEIARDYLFLIKEVATMRNCVSIFITDYHMLNDLVSECDDLDEVDIDRNNPIGNNPTDTFLDKFFNYKIDLTDESPEIIMSFYDNHFNNDPTFESIYDLCGMSPSTWYRNVIAKISAKIQMQEKEYRNLHLSKEDTDIIKKRMHKQMACRSIIVNRLQIPRNVVKFYVAFKDNVQYCHQQLLQDAPESEKEKINKYIRDRNICQILFLLSFAKVCTPVEYQQIVKTGATYIETPIYGDPVEDNCERQLLQYLLSETVLNDYDDLRKLNSYLRAETRTFIDAFVKQDVELSQLVNPFTTQDEKWIKAIVENDPYVVGPNWNEMVAMILNKVPGKDSSISNELRNSILSKLLSFADQQIEKEEWTYDKVFDLFDLSTKIDRYLSVGNGSMQIFWNHIQNYKLSPQDAKRALENMQEFFARYAYLRIGHIYRLAHYLISDEKKHKITNLQETFRISNSNNIEKISQFLTKLAEEILGIALSGDRWHETYRQLAMHIFNYLDNHNLLKYVDVREEADEMLDTANEFFCLEAIIEHLQRNVGVQRNESLSNGDYNDVEKVLQYFSEELNNPTIKRDISKEFAGFFKKLSSVPNIITKTSQIEQLHELVTLYIGQTGYHSMPYRRILTHILEELTVESVVDKNN